MVDMLFKVQVQAKQIYRVLSQESGDLGEEACSWGNDILFFDGCL